MASVLCRRHDYPLISQVYPAKREADIKFDFKLLVIGHVLNMTSMREVLEYLETMTSKSPSSRCSFFKLRVGAIQFASEKITQHLSSWRNCIYTKLTLGGIVFIQIISNPDSLFQFKDEKTCFHTFWLQASMLTISALNAFFHSFRVMLKIFLTGASFQQC